METQNNLVDKLRQPFTLAELTTKQIGRDEFKRGAAKLAETDPDKLLIITESLTPGETTQRELRFSADGAIFFKADTSKPKVTWFRVDGPSTIVSEDVSMASIFEPFKDVVVPLERALTRVLIAGGGEPEILWNQVMAGKFNDEIGQVNPSDADKQKFACDAILGKIKVTPKPNMASGSAGGQFGV